MRIRLFPSGKVHSAYLDLVNHSPEGVQFIGNFSYSTGSFVDFSGKDTIASILDWFNLPYIFFMESDYPFHSCQKLLSTNVNYVIDIEHGNPFMGSENVFKHKHEVFRWLTKRILNNKNCKMIMPWSNIAKDAFCLNFDFLGDDLLDEKVRVVYPATFPFSDDVEKYRNFTFIFIAGRSFYPKGGVQTLESFKMLLDLRIDANLIVVGAVPDKEKIKYSSIKEIIFYPHIDRIKLLDMLAKCHCLVLPSMGDTFGMVLLEAKARGIPAIVVDSFSAKEIVEHDVTGIVIEPDYSIYPWFDINGRKQISKSGFHSQFSTYVPSLEHVSKLSNAMLNMIDSPNSLRIMGMNAKNETKNGRFSLWVRNKVLKDIYEGL